MIRIIECFSRFLAACELLHMVGVETLSKCNKYLTFLHGCGMLCSGNKKRIIRMLEGPYAERVHTRLPAPDPDNTGVGNAFLLLDAVGRWTRWQVGCFPDEKHPFYFAQTKKKERL